MAGQPRAGNQAGVLLCPCSWQGQVAAAHLVEVAVGYPALPLPLPSRPAFQVLTAAGLRSPALPRPLPAIAAGVHPSVPRQRACTADSHTPLEPHPPQLCIVNLDGTVERQWRIQRIQEVLVAKGGRYVLVRAAPCLRTWESCLGGVLHRADTAACLLRAGALHLSSRAS